MKKIVIIMASAGGAALLAIAIIGYLAFAALSDQSETRDAIDTALQNVQRINSRPIAPIQDSIIAIDANTATLEKWYAEALQLVGVGDLAPDTMLTPSSFKEKLVSESAELSKEPGNVLGSIVKEGYAFGFDRFITGSDLPEEDKLSDYDRQWADIKVIVKALSSAGGSELVSVEVKPLAEILKSIGVSVPEAGAGDKKNDRKNARGNQRGGNKKSEASKPADSYSIQGYHIVYRARPQAQVKFLNELASSQQRFLTTFNLSFTHEDDPIARVLAPAKNATQETTTKKSKRGKKSRSAEKEENVDESGAKTSGLIIDTDHAGELVISLDLATIDFKTKSAAPDKIAEPQVKEEK